MFHSLTLLYWGRLVLSQSGAVHQKKHAFWYSTWSQTGWHLQPIALQRCSAVCFAEMERKMWASWHSRGSSRTADKYQACRSFDVICPFLASFGGDDSNFVMGTTSNWFITKWNQRITQRMLKCRRIWCMFLMKIFTQVPWQTHPWEPGTAWPCGMTSSQDNCLGKIQQTSDHTYKQTREFKMRLRFFSAVVTPAMLFSLQMNTRLFDDMWSSPYPPHAKQNLTFSLPCCHSALRTCQGQFHHFLPAVERLSFLGSRYRVSAFGALHHVQAPNKQSVVCHIWHPNLLVWHAFWSIPFSPERPAVCGELKVK